MTILHVIPTLEGGGAERQLSMLATEQSRRGHDVHLAVRRTGVHVQTVRDCGVQIHELGDMRSTNPMLLVAIRRAIFRVRPSIVQTWLPQMDILGGLAALIARIPWIVSERTSGDYYTEIPVVARLRLFLGQFASAVIANSDGGEKYWHAAAYRSPKLITVRNALDVARIGEATAPDFPDCFPNPVLLVVGRFTREKALEIIVRALGDLSMRSAVNVLIIGEGSERPALEREIEAASLSGCVKILPYQRDWWRWLKLAAGLISMSRYEGNPNVVLEAMAGCCPVILSDIPAHREIADASSALFVPVDDVGALASAMGNLLVDKDAALLRAAQAHERVRSMTVTAMADAYEAVYREVLDGIN
ncbi:glycosyltransferase [Bradyrhizobium sp. S3.3.6]|uniref:glycosyltransferase n=1 Tax=Bradyrhizobium sp. S3.3.6 TaxID=3156429 RepID=UPI003394EB34